jgi:hypothetical protein
MSTYINIKNICISYVYTSRIPHQGYVGNRWHQLPPEKGTTWLPERQNQEEELLPCTLFQYPVLVKFKKSFIFNWKICKYRRTVPYLKLLETRSVSDFGIFQVLEYLHTHGEVCWGWEQVETGNLHLTHITWWECYAWIKASQGGIFHLWCHVDIPKGLDFGVFWLLNLYCVTLLETVK